MENSTPGSFGPRPLLHPYQSGILKSLALWWTAGPAVPCPIEAHLPGPDPRQARERQARERQARERHAPASPHNTCHEGLIDPFI